MNYQLLALDLDGTLTNSRKEITPSTRDALIDIQKNGKKVVLASGRPSQGVLPLAEELHLGDYGSYILSYNGGRITDCRSGEIIYSKYLPNDVAAPLLEIVKKYPGIDILAYTDTELISGGDTNEYSEKESFINHMPITKVDDFISYVTKNNNNKFLITGEPELIQEVNGEMTSTQVVDGKKLTFPYTLDITGAPGVSAGTLYVSEQINGTYQQLGQYPISFQKAE